MPLRRRCVARSIPMHIRYFLLEVCELSCTKVEIDLDRRIGSCALAVRRSKERVVEHVASSDRARAAYECSEFMECGVREYGVRKEKLHLRFIEAEVGRVAHA